MREHHVGQLGAVLREERGEGIGRHRLRELGEAADVAEEDHHLAPDAAGHEAAGRLRDGRGHVRRHEALEVGAEQRLAPERLLGPRVPERRGGEAGQRGQEPEILLGEAPVAHQVGVEHAQRAGVGEERGGEGAPHVEQLHRRAAEARVGGGIVGLQRLPALDRGARDGLRDPHLAGRAAAAPRRRGDELAAPLLREEERHAVGGEEVERGAHDGVEQRAEVGLGGEAPRHVEEPREPLAGAGAGERLLRLAQRHVAHHLARGGGSARGDRRA